MREINVSQITDVIEKLCIEANEHLPEDVKCAIKIVVPVKMERLQKVF